MVGSKDMPPLTAPLMPNQFVRAQFCYKPVLPPPHTDLSGQVVIVTGSNMGLGFEISRQFLSYRLSRLIMAVRSLDKGKVAAAQLQRAYPQATIEVWKLDMSSPGSVRAFASRAETELPRLDVAVLNAGISPMHLTANQETGHEETIQVNYLSTMLLLALLLPILKSKSPEGIPGRAIFVSSVLATNAKLHGADAPHTPLLRYVSDFRTRAFDPMEQYCTSKLLGLMFLWKLADCVSADDVIVSAVEPGFVKGTGLARDARGATKIAVSLFGAATGRPVNDGASTILDAAINHGKESHGCFLMNFKIRSFVPSMYTAEGRERIDSLWEETMREPSFQDVPGILEQMKRAKQ
ncbi:hypothetical protein VTK73DRAFT_9793 [Phialemonium thermophilum]|uniref:Short-chain dehydrogenase/reductase family protein n=1 Tax=Phialemonium thermophilum TaxID=223376 RepID=A0ABR3W0B9_9PEZI